MILSANFWTEASGSFHVSKGVKPPIIMYDHEQMVGTQSKRRSNLGWLSRFHVLSRRFSWESGGEGGGEGVRERSREGRKWGREGGLVLSLLLECIESRRQFNFHSVASFKMAKWDCERRWSCLPGEKGHFVGEKMKRSTFASVCEREKGKDSCNTANFLNLIHYQY